MPESARLNEVIYDSDLKERAAILERKNPTQLLAYIAALLEMSVAKQLSADESLSDIQSHLYSLNVDVGNTVEVDIPNPLPVKIENDSIDVEVQNTVDVEVKNIYPLSVTVE